MLKLKYLFDNKDLAHMILKKWEHDNDYPDFLKYFRISANAVYWCKNNGETFFLRFAPIEEKSKENILAELDFINYLRANRYSVVETILSKSGKELERVITPWGVYYAVAFRKTSGKQIRQLHLTKDLIFGLGKALGKLHRLSSTFKPSKNKRCNYKEMLNWMETVLLTCKNETKALKELAFLRDYLLKLPITNQCFGLIHYDFEFDNVFYDEATNIFTPIDFDDAIYHWYAMDIERSLNSIKEEMPKDQIAFAIEQFMLGYRFEYAISDEMINILPIFHRYANLYTYVRILTAIKTEWENEPDWMIDLRVKLTRLLEQCQFN